MKKISFILLILLTGACIFIWTNVFKEIQDRSEQENGTEEMEILKEANENFSERMKNNKNDKYSSEEEYLKTVDQRLVTTEFLLGEWESVGAVSYEEGIVTFTNTEMTLFMLDEQPMVTSYSLVEENNLQFIDMEGEYGSTSGLINLVDDNTVKINIKGTYDNMILTRVLAEEAEPDGIDPNDFVSDDYFESDSFNEETSESDIINPYMPDESLQYHILSSLGPSYTEVSPEVIAEIEYLPINYGVRNLQGMEYATNLKDFSLSYPSEISEPIELDFSPLLALENLKTIGISAPVNHDLMKEINRLKQIEYIEFYNMTFESLKELEYLLSFKFEDSFKEIKFTRTNLISEDLEYLREINPNVRITIGY